MTFPDDSNWDAMHGGPSSLPESDKQQAADTLRQAARALDKYTVSSAGPVSINLPQTAAANKYEIRVEKGPITIHLPKTVKACDVISQQMRGSTEQLRMMVNSRLDGWTFEQMRDYWPNLPELVDAICTIFDDRRI